MSSTGALVESPVVPPPGTPVYLVRGALSAEGRVVWTARNRCGLNLTTQVHIRDWLAPATNLEQQRVDQIVTLVKAGAVPLPTGSLTSREPMSPSLSSGQLTRDLGLVSRLIDDLGDELSSEPETLRRHAVKLQNLDIAMQILAALCKEIRAEQRGNGSGMARIEDLRTSAGQALAKP